jgi:hypothetical protein
MQSRNPKSEQRLGSRVKAVLPIRIKGRDSAGEAFEEWAHTLDVTSVGARLGAVRRELNVLEEITVVYHQRRISFRVVWTKKMKGTSEFQVGLQAVTTDKEAWGVSLAVSPSQPQVSVSRAMA